MPFQINFVESDAFQELGSNSPSFDNIFETGSFDAIASMLFPAFVPGGFQTDSFQMLGIAIPTQCSWTFTTTQAGASSDYTKYLLDEAVLTDRDGSPILLDFELAAGDDPAFVKLIRGAYIKMGSVQTPNWFTGYITNDPELEYLGVDSHKNPIWGYKYEATDDSYMLSLKPIGLLPPFINQTADQILAALVGILDTYQIFTLNFATGPFLARYIVDPNKKFVDIVQDLSTIADFRFAANNHVLTFQAKDVTPATISIDGHSLHFTPSMLNIKPTTDPLVNDCTVVGAPEPQDYISEYWVGDGFTAQFPLLSGLYGQDGSLLVSDDFSGSTLSTSNWNIFDSLGNTFQLFGGYLNVLGGPADDSLSVHLDTVQVLPLEAGLRMTHGQWDFVSAGSRPTSGIIGGLWSQAVNPLLTGCITGIKVAATGTALTLFPIVNGLVDSSQSFVVDFTKRYVFRTLVNFNTAIRGANEYSYIDQAGHRHSAKVTVLPDTASLSIFIYEFDPVTAATTRTMQFQNLNVVIPNNIQFANYVPVVANDLHCTFMGVTVSVPMMGALSEGVTLGNLVTKILGVNEIDALDGLAPTATIVTDGSSGQSQTNGLGTPLFNPGDATLTFFKDSTRQVSFVPQIGQFINLAYRRCGLAVGEVISPSSIALEAAAWGDDGYRALCRSDISPAPRTSAECETAAAALVQDFSFQHFEGDYTQYSLFEFSGQPLSGTVLNFKNLAGAFPSTLQAEIVNEVTSTLYLRQPQEYFVHKLSFGKPSNISKAIAKFYRTEQEIDFGINVDSADTPTPVQLASLGLVNVPDVTGATLVGYTSSVDADVFEADTFETPTYQDGTILVYNFNTNVAAPVGGGFEVRLTDDSWGADDGKNLVVRTGLQTFSVPRNVRGKICFVKAYDARNLVLHSEDLTNAVWVTAGSTTVANFMGINPMDSHAQISSVALGASGSISQTLSQLINSTTGTFSISLNGVAGQQVVIQIINGSTLAVDGSLTVTLNGHWQRFSVSCVGVGEVAHYKVQIANVGGVAQTVQMTWASFELAAAETGYFKTNATAYGAMSRFPQGLRVNFPLIPPSPTSTADLTDPANPVIFLVLPTLLQDVWGVEIRAADNTTVLYHSDLVNSGYGTVDASGNPIGIQYKVAGNTSRTFTYYVYTYNLLGEYSVGVQQTLAFFTPVLIGLAVDEGVGNLKWTGTHASSYLVEDFTDAGFTTSVLSKTVTDQFYHLDDENTLRQRYFRVTPQDGIGNGTPVTLSHAHTPASVVAFTGSGNVYAIDPQPTPVTDITAPTAFTANQLELAEIARIQRTINQTRK